MEYKDYLDTTVLQEKKPVTYRSLARNFNIHVNAAKQALYHYTTVESSVIAIFCLSGTLIDQSFSIRLVSQNDLEETKKLYRQVIGVHVYSILPCQPKDLSVLVTVNKDTVAGSVEDRIKNGLLFNNSVKMNSSAKASIPTSSTPSKAPTTTVPPPVKNTIEKKSTFGSTSTSKPTPTATTPSKRKGTLSFDKATPRVAKKQEIEKSKPPSPPRRKVKTIQESEDEASEESEEALDERLARSARIQVNDIFSDDDENDGQETSSKDQGDSTAAPSPSMDIEMNTVDDDKSDNDSSKTDQNENSNQDKEPEPAPGKVRRKVQKKKTYKNERGFLVTEDVWEWEEVDDDTPSAATSSATAKKSSSAPAKKPSTPKKTPGEQKSLLSFWGKR